LAEPAERCSFASSPFTAACHCCGFVGFAALLARPTGTTRPTAMQSTLMPTTARRGGLVRMSFRRASNFTIFPFLLWPSHPRCGHQQSPLRQVGFLPHHLSTNRPSSVLLSAHVITASLRASPPIESPGIDRGSYDNRRALQDDSHRFGDVENDEQIEEESEEKDAAYRRDHVPASSR
jgi:hypothetical protein